MGTRCDTNLGMATYVVSDLIYGFCIQWKNQDVNVSRHIYYMVKYQVKTRTGSDRSIPL